MKGIHLLLIFLVLTGCSKVVVRSDSDPSMDLSTVKSIYVRKFTPDGRGLEKVIEKKLNEFGFHATSGSTTNPGEHVDAIITYKDRWMWDITMYLLEIDISLHDPVSDYIFASGSSYRTSLARESPEMMIDEVLREIFAGTVDLPEKKEDTKEDTYGE